MGVESGNGVVVNGRLGTGMEGDAKAVNEEDLNMN